MSLTSDMSTLDLKNVSSFESLDPNSSQKTEVWESWEQVRLSNYHGKKLVKKNFMPYHPKVKKFFLHEIDNFDFEPGEKVTMIMRTLKKVFGNMAHSNSTSGKRVNAKLSFIRVKALKHFQDGKSVKDLIEFPKSYWDAHKILLNSQESKRTRTSSCSLKRHFDTKPDKVD